MPSVGARRVPTSLSSRPFLGNPGYRRPCRYPSCVAHAAFSARRDRDVFKKADEVYPAVGLCQHPKKKIREADNQTVVGDEIEGRIGTIAAPRLLTAMLIALTLEQIRLRASTPRLFTCVVGCWVQVFLYRSGLS